MKNKSLLLVDDEKMNLDFLSLVLNDDYNLFMASDGVEALEVLQNNQDINAILSDLRMPNMDGIDLISKVYEINPNIPCFLLTAYEMSERIEKELEKGHIRKYISKPIDIQNLTTMLADELDLAI